MIKHIVLWELKDFAEGADKQQNALRLKEALEKLNGKVPGLIRLEVGIAIGEDADGADVVLYSEFENQEALQSYYSHPGHLSVVPFAKAIRSERRMIDYEVNDS